jgi:hypothetical protein
VYRQLRWRLPLRDYFNSGVTVWPDSEGARSLAALWHARWLQSKAVGIVTDQPALNAANMEAGRPIRPLDVTFNAMIDADPRLAANAHVIHYFNSARGPFGRNLLEQMIASGPVSAEGVQGVIQRISESHWPFETPEWSRERLAGSLAARSCVQMVRMVLHSVLP